MTPELPEFLMSFSQEAEQYLEQGLVRDIQFSSGTYQIQIIDRQSKEEVWAHLNLDDQGHIQECFCSCGQGEEQSYCVHIAAAFLRIFNHQANPLHIRFEQSLWNQLAKIYSFHFHDQPSVLKKVSSGHYSVLDKKEGINFFIKAQTKSGKELLKRYIEYRPRQTEENSLKFSHLSQEEIRNWRAGRPSPQLRYELSLWYDIAQWLMFLQDSKARYKIEFSYSKKSLPESIKISFFDVVVGFLLPEEDLPSIIPSLNSVHSPLAVHYLFQESIKEISYDKKKGTFHLIAKKDMKKNLPKKGVVIDGWLYVPKKGFYAFSENHLLGMPTLSSEKVSEALTKYFSLFRKLLVGDKIHQKPIRLSYELTFDDDWNLHIRAFAFKPGDLQKGHSRFFDDWIYLDGKGFYAVENLHFPTLNKIIPAKDISDFVRQERSWLNSIEGFSIHQANVESQITYQLTQDSRLIFARSVLKQDREQNKKDFGAWVYVEGRGFYAKESIQTSLPIGFDLAIPAHHIPIFIRMNRSELELVSNFFSDRSPVKTATINIELTKKGNLLIRPSYTLLSEYEDQDIRFFDEYVYVAGEGFHEIAAQKRLPEPYLHPVEIKASEFPAFFDKEWSLLSRYISAPDKRFQEPKEIELYADKIVKTDVKNQYALQLSFKTEYGIVPFAEVWDAFKKKKRFLFSNAGRLDVNREEFQVLRSISKQQIDQKSNQLFFSTLELIRLNALEEIHINEHDSSSITIMRELSEFHVPEEPDTKGLTSALRPYQKLGAHWLWFLYYHHLSGLLCDEMGLGKTHQAMALFAAICNYFKKYQDKKNYFLVICPTSVIYHWKEKIAEYLPNFKVRSYHGGSRSLQDFFEQDDILLTSYGVWRLEYEKLKKIPFEVAVLDEIQIAKNPRSRVHASLRHVNAQMYLGLTGTPIENHLRELKALFDLIMPTYMPGDAEYRERFLKPIERNENPKRKQLLRRFTSPFILRRKKADVLPDLPEKTEEISHCDLSPEQQQMYMEVLQQSRNRVLKQLRDESEPIPYLHVFAILSALKQICDHPAVFLKQPNQYMKFQSGKWELFLELLNEARDSQQKVVVFTQYLAMLDIFNLHLKESGIKFAEIRGATIDRGEQVSLFNNDPKCEVFLGSLQAAGLGVDLTAGSVVIHYDRWWNAARENQATDRVHRIGQTRGVQVFKLVTKNSFEERIDELITKKSRLLEEVVSADDHRFLKHFTRDELIELLQDIETGEA